MTVSDSTNNSFSPTTEPDILRARDVMLAQMGWVRNYSLELIRSVPQELWFVMPQPCRTHLAWQVGHLAVAQYGLMLFRQRGRLAGDDVEGFDTDQGAAGGVSERLGGHDPHAQTGVTARPDTDDDGGQVARLASKLREQLLHGGNEIARVTPGFVEAALTEEFGTVREGDETGLMRGFQK